MHEIISKIATRRRQVKHTAAAMRCASITPHAPSAGELLSMFCKYPMSNIYFVDASQLCGRQIGQLRRAAARHPNHGVEDSAVKCTSSAVWCASWKGSSHDHRPESKRRCAFQSVVEELKQILSNADETTRPVVEQFVRSVSLPPFATLVWQKVLVVFSPLDPEGFHAVLGSVDIENRWFKAGEVNDTATSFCFEFKGPPPPKVLPAATIGRAASAVAPSELKSRTLVVRNGVVTFDRGFLNCPHMSGTEGASANQSSLCVLRPGQQVTKPIQSVLPLLPVQLRRECSKVREPKVLGALIQRLDASDPEEPYTVLDENDYKLVAVDGGFAFVFRQALWNVSCAAAATDELLCTELNYVRLLEGGFLELLAMRLGLGDAGITFEDPIVEQFAVDVKNGKYAPPPSPRSDSYGSSGGGSFMWWSFS